ncbi:hypothetical protein N431DRAFT_468544 [Stipitochalara longipes BDJ]|nr:hypothetical protein N431DRAFT_468544 [Stipitochalara longipes BDJ]
MGTFNAIGLNNPTIQLETASDFPGAEAKYLEALRMKQRDPKKNYISIAAAQNVLGELCLKMRKLEKVEDMFQTADAIRSELNDFNAACARLNPGHFWELNGDFSETRCS